MEETLDLTGFKEHMIGYTIVSKIYEIRDFFIFAEERTEYKGIIMNLKILDHIREVNFVFIKGVGILEDIKETTKVGNLLNFEVFLDPLHPDNIITFAGENLEPAYLKINF